MLDNVANGLRICGTSRTQAENMIAQEGDLVGGATGRVGSHGRSGVRTQYHTALEGNGQNRRPGGFFSFLQSVRIAGVGIDRIR